MSMSRVAPAALGTTLVTSVAGLGAYLLLSLSSTDAVGPEWAIGVSSGLGGLVGGYLGAWLQPSLPQRALTLLLGGLAIGIALLYVVQSQG
jgi:hypothetical protein